jgi:hypothetical protein
MTMTAFACEGLRLLGYSGRESEFLFLTAIHSGYFTIHQFKRFVKSESGSLCHAFIRKLLERKHASFRAYRSGERVYHLFARKLYQAMDRENLRTRKKHELEYIKTRLVALDFVLLNPAERYLETEPEKLEFFERECGLGRSLLPVKLYRARKSADVTPRYFVDRFPMFLATETGRLTFTFIDGGAVTTNGFSTHLRSYLPLLQALPAFDFVFVSPTPRLFRAAESEFQRMVSGHGSSPSTPDLLRYFELRRAWDARERVASSDVVILKEAQAKFTGKRFDDTYQQWRISKINDDEVMALGKHFERPERCTFRVLLCGDSLKVFRDPLANRAESWTRQQEATGQSQISSELSGP